MTPGRSHPTRCTVKSCPVLGHFAAHGGRCPMHRDDTYTPPRAPSLSESWIADGLLPLDPEPDDE